MHDLFRAVTLSFLIAALYLVLSATIDYVAIYALQSGDRHYGPDENFRMALAATSLHASLLCVWVLLAIAFARKYVTRLRAPTTLYAALSVAAPMVLLNLLLRLIAPGAEWSPTAGLVFSLLWSSGGLHIALWYLTAGKEIPE